MNTGKTVILADGRFPEHPIPIEILRNAQNIICCDGAVEKLVNYGLEPYAIIGDLDSITQTLKEKYSSILIKDTDQETNDLTKAVKWCSNNGFKEIYILGATGKREDHAIGNISLLADVYCKSLNAKMYTNYGVFSVIYSSTTFKCYIGQQISIFSMDNSQLVTFRGLKYPLVEESLTAWWMATLNEAVKEEFTIQLSNDSPVIVFINY